MSLETLLTLAVAGVLLAIATILRLALFAVVRLVRASSGRPIRRERSLAAAVAAPSWGERMRPIGHGIKRVVAGAVALVVFVVAATWTRLAAWWSGDVESRSTS